MNSIYKINLEISRITYAIRCNYKIVKKSPFAIAHTYISLSKTIDLVRFTRSIPFNLKTFLHCSSSKTRRCSNVFPPRPYCLVKSLLFSTSTTTISSRLSITLLWPQFANAPGSGLKCNVGPNR